MGVCDLWEERYELTSTGNGNTVSNRRLLWWVDNFILHIYDLISDHIKCVITIGDKAELYFLKKCEKIHIFQPLIT